MTSGDLGRCRLEHPFPTEGYVWIQGDVVDPLKSNGKYCYSTAASSGSDQAADALLKSLRDAGITASGFASENPYGSSRLIQYKTQLGDMTAEEYTKERQRVAPMFGPNPNDPNYLPAP